MTIDDFNPDALDIAELHSFGMQLLEEITPETAREFFNNATPRGYFEVYKQCVRCAYYKALAMQLRLEGRIALALEQERICDQIYNALPDYAKW